MKIIWSIDFEYLHNLHIKILLNDYLSRPDVQNGIRQLADFDMTYDILVSTFAFSK